MTCEYLGLVSLQRTVEAYPTNWVSNELQVTLNQMLAYLFPDHMT